MEVTKVYGDKNCERALQHTPILHYVSIDFIVQWPTCTVLAVSRVVALFMDIGSPRLTAMYCRRNTDSSSIEKK